MKVRAEGYAILMLATIAIFACGGSVEKMGTIEIGSDLPTSGADAGEGLPVQ